MSPFICQLWKLARWAVIAPWTTCSFCICVFYLFSNSFSDNEPMSIFNMRLFLISDIFPNAAVASIPSFRTVTPVTFVAYRGLFRQSRVGRGEQSAGRRDDPWEKAAAPQTIIKTTSAGKVRQFLNDNSLKDLIISHIFVWIHLQCFHPIDSEANERLMLLNIFLGGLLKWSNGQRS